MTDPGTYEEQSRQTSTVERTLTILLMIGLGVLVPIASFLGLLFGMVSDGCIGATECNSDQIGLGVLMASGSPWVVFVAALVWVVRRMRARRSTWWVPLVALVVGAGVWMLGGVIAASGVG